MIFMAFDKFPNTKKAFKTGSLFDFNDWKTDATLSSHSFGSQGFTSPIDVVFLLGDNGGNTLKHQLRSVYYNAPWIRHVYVLTRDEVPEWINPYSDTISIVPFSALTDIPKPTELQLFVNLHRVKSLAGAFIYLGSTGFISRKIDSKDIISTEGEVKLSVDPESLSPLVVSKKFLSNNEKALSKYAIKGEEKSFLKEYDALLKKELNKPRSRTVKQSKNTNDLKFRLGEFTDEEKKRLVSLGVVESKTEYPDTKIYNKNTCQLYDNLRQFVNQETWSLDIKKLTEFASKTIGRELTEIDKSDLLNVLSGKVDVELLKRIAITFSENCFILQDKDKISSTIYGRVLVENTLVHKLFSIDGKSGNNHERACDEKILNHKQRMARIPKDVLENIRQGLDIPVFDDSQETEKLTISSLIWNAPLLLVEMSKMVCQAEWAIDVRDGYRFIPGKQPSYIVYDNEKDVSEQLRLGASFIKVTNFEEHHEEKDEAARRGFRRFLAALSPISSPVEVPFNNGDNPSSARYRHLGSVAREGRLKAVWWRKLGTVAALTGPLGALVGARARRHFAGLVGQARRQ